MKAYDYESRMPVVSEERIREELIKCFKCDNSRITKSHSPTKRLYF